MSLVDYGDRGVPNVFLEAPLTSAGAVERGALQEQARTTRWSSSTWRRSTSRPNKSIAAKIETAAAGRDADRDPVLDRRPDGVDTAGRRREPDLDRAAVPERGLQGMS